MKSKKLVLGLFSFILIFLIINAVYAKEDFYASASPSLELCPCSNQAYSITVQNIGDEVSSYEIIAGGDAAGFVSFQPNKFALGPGEGGSLLAIVNSECNVKGNFNLEIYITTNKGLTKLIKQGLKISECYDYSFEQGKAIDEVNESLNFLAQEGSYALCTNEKKSIPILFTNNEDFGNQYKLYLDAPEWAKLNIEDVKVDGKKSGIVLINLDTANIPDDFNFKLSALSELGKVQRNSDIKVKVGECYSLSLESEKESDVVCGGEENKFSLVVKNTGTLDNNIDIEVDGAEWAGFNIGSNKKINESYNDAKSKETGVKLAKKTSIFLKSEQEKIIDLYVIPEYESSGKFQLNINSIPENKTEYSSSDSINIDAIKKTDCYRANINAKSSITHLYKEDVFFVKVTNTGIKKAVYEASLEGPSWVRISPDELALNPGQTGNFNIRVNPKEDSEAGIYTVKLNLDANGVAYFKDIELNLRQETQFEKSFKSAIIALKYYLYLILFILALILIFIKPILRTKNNLVGKYNKYKLKRQRIRNLKLAREKRKEEQAQKKEAKIESKKETKERKKPKRKSNFWKKYESKVYWLIGLILVLAFLVSRFETKLKYIHIYAWNLVYGYLYYILMSIGVVLFLLFFYYIIHRITNERSSKVKKTKKSYKNKVFFAFIAAIILFALLNQFSLYDEIKDFFILYSYYFVLGIVILAVIILALRFYKPLAKFFK